MDENVFIVFLWKSLQNFTFFLAHRAMQVQYLVLFSRKCCLPHSIFCFSLYHPYNAIPALDAHFMRIWLWRWTVYATDSSTLQLHTRHRDACAKCAVLRIKRTTGIKHKKLIFCLYRIEYEYEYSKIAKGGFSRWLISKYLFEIKKV